MRNISFVTALLFLTDIFVGFRYHLIIILSFYFINFSLNLVDLSQRRYFYDKTIS